MYTKTKNELTKINFNLNSGIQYNKQCYYFCMISADVGWVHVYLTPTLTLTMN